LSSHSIAWFSAAALVAIVVLTQIGHWYKRHPSARKKAAHAPHATLSRGRVMSQPIERTPVEAYLRRRGITALHGTGSLRFHPRCPVAMDICSKQEPRFLEASHDHFVACWRVG